MVASIDCNCATGIISTAHVVRGRALIDIRSSSTLEQALQISSFRMNVVAGQTDCLTCLTRRENRTKGEESGPGRVLGCPRNLQ